MKFRFLIPFLFSVSLMAQTPSCTGATCNALSVSQTDFINAWPTSGNTNPVITITVPAGTGVWTNQVTETVPACATVVIKGASTVSCTGTPGTLAYACTPTDNTIIQDNIAGNFGVLQINGATCSTPQQVRVTGLSFFPGTGTNKFQGDLLFYSGNANNQVQVDNNHFKLITGPTGWAGRFNNCWTGVVTTNVFDNASPTDTGSVFQGFMHANTCGADGFGDAAWATATNFGAPFGAIYEENNIFNGGLEGDCDIAGKWVSRYNTLNSNSQSSSWIHTHGTEQNGGRSRGCRSLEAYHDVFNIAASSSVLFGTTAGPLMIWGNVLNHATVFFSSFGDERNDGQHFQNPAGTSGASCTGAPGSVCWGFCGASTINPNTGLANGVGSLWDFTTSGNGYPCLDQPGRGVNEQALNGVSFPGALNSSTGTIAWPQQDLEVVYEFMNSTGGSPATQILGNSQLDRDIRVDNPSFSGGSGTGFGPAASRPSTCTAGPGGSSGKSPGGGSYGALYFETDNQCADICTSTNTWNYGGSCLYRPYIYPYPGTGSGVSLTVTTAGSGTGTASGPNCNFGSSSFASGTSVGTCTFAATGGSTLTSLVGTGNAVCSGSTCAMFNLSIPTTITATFAGGTPTCGAAFENSPNFGGTYPVPPTPLPIAVGLTSPTAGCNIFYTATTNGSTPATPNCSSTAYPGGGFSLATIGDYKFRWITCQNTFVSSGVLGDEWKVTNSLPPPPTAVNVNVTITSGVTIR